MSRARIFLLLLFMIPLQLLAQRRLLPVGSELEVTEITSWDPEYKNKDKIVGKKAVVSTRPLLFSGDNHWSGYITVDGTEYRILDMTAEIRSGLVPEKKVEPKNVLKLQSGIKELVAMAPQEFSSIKTSFAKLLPSHSGEAFLASYQLSGAQDSSTIVYYDEYVKRWNLRTLINTSQYSWKEVDQLITALDLPCGKLEPRPDNDDYTSAKGMVSRTYVPADRMKPGNNYRYFTLDVSAIRYNGEDNLIELRMKNRSFEMSLLAEQSHLEPPTPAKDLKKMEKDILALVNEYKTDFSKIRVGNNYKDEYLGTCNKISYQMEGSEDGVAVLDATTNTWKLNIPIATDRYSSKDLDKLLLSMKFPFGMLEMTDKYADTNSRTYKPKDRTKLTGPYKDLDVTVLSSLVGEKEIMLVFLVQKAK